MKFRKKPVVVEAAHYTGDGNFENSEVPNWIWQALQDGVLSPSADGNLLKIKTLEGVMEVSAGDWIIQGVKGELYPCKPDIFEATYDLVEDPHLKDAASKFRYE